MSRNICRTDCARCCGDVVLDEAPRLLTREEAGAHFDNYRTKSFANAHCPTCGARYLAWIQDLYTGLHHDLSWRSTFNDEPGDDDLPPWNPPAPSVEEAREVLAKLAAFWYQRSRFRSDEVYELCETMQDDIQSLMETIKNLDKRSDILLRHLDRIEKEAK